MRLQGRVLFSVAMAAAIALTAHVGAAQTCQGTASWAAGATQVGAGITTGNYETILGAGFGYGGAEPIFLRAGFEHSSTDNDGSANGGTAQVGYQIQPESMPNFQVCPAATFGYWKYSWPDDFSENDNMIKVGLSVGSEVSQSETFALVPFGAFSFVRYGWSYTEFGEDFSSSDTGFHLDLGAGLLFNGKYLVRPMVTIPASFEGHKTAFGVSGYVSVGNPAG